jgi:hypothetical protein
MRPNGVGFGSPISSAPIECSGRRANAGSGRGFCQTQQSAERLEAIIQIRSSELEGVSVDWRTHAFCVRRALLEPKKISAIVSTCHGRELLRAMHRKRDEQNKLSEL